VFAVVLLAASLSACRTGEKKMELARLVPHQVSGWSAQGDDELYDRATLFHYINGAAEVYLRYSFQQVLVREFTHPAEPRISLQLFDMGSSEDAYGIFSFEAEGDGVGIGQDSEYAMGLLRFWKGRYMVCVQTHRETPQAKETVFALARAVAGAIEEPGERPAMLDLLPRDGLVRSTVRYFHEPFGLSYHYPVAEGNPFDLGKDTDVLLASYRLQESVARLVLVQYPGEAQALAAFRKLAERYEPLLTHSGLEGEPVQADDAGWVGARSLGRFVVAVFDAPSEADAKRLLDGVSRRISER